MIYTIKNEREHYHVDTDRIAKRLANNETLYVRSKRKDRKKLIEFLEANGFTCVESDAYDRQGILECGLPLGISMKDKTINCIGNITCAAAAAQCGIIMSDKDFYLLYSIRTADK